MATKYKYDKDTDYAALMERAAQRGDNAAARSMSSSATRRSAARA